MTTGVETTIILMISYSLGSIPCSLLLAKLTKSTDPRVIGSGNIGATNVLRTGRQGLALLTLFLDVSKGAIAVSLALIWTPSLSPWAALAAVIGHVFPVWLNFHGGKGVATSLGSLAVLSWPIFLLACGLWLCMAAWKRIASLASLVSLSGATFAAILLTQFFEIITVNDTITTGAITLIVIFAHRMNIDRLLKGAEPPFSFSKKSSL